MNQNSFNESSQRTTKLEDRVTFLFVCVGVIALTYGFLALIDFLPEKPSATSLNEEVQEAIPDTETTEIFVTDDASYPTRIIFDSLDKEISIVNPESDSVPALDAALLEGAVRHPDSADFKNTGTIFILGHSSYLPNVMNKNFQAFNGIQKLVSGDTIRLQSKDREYVYRVDRTYEAKASNAEVPMQYEKEKLTLATCNSFGTKDDRYIVEASLVESYELNL